MSADLVRLNQALQLRAQFRQHIGNPKARRVLAAKLTELEAAPRLDARDVAACCTVDGCCCSLHDRTDSHATTSSQESHRSPMSNPTDAARAAARKRAYLDSFRPLHDGPPTQQEQVRLDAAERDYDQRVVNEAAGRAHRARPASADVTRLDGNVDNDGDTEGAKARKRMRAKAANAWRLGPVTPEEQRKLDLARASRDPDDAA